MTGRFRFWDFATRQYVFTDIVLRLSPTDIKAAKEKCELKVFHKLTQPKLKEKSLPLIVGSVFHDVMAENFKHKLKHRRDMDLGILTGTLEECWKKGIKKAKENTDEMDKLEAKSKCLKYIQVYWEKRCKVLYPKNWKSIEFFQTFTARREDESYKMILKIDLVTNAGIIVDHKTAKDMRDWTQEKADNEPQAHLYQVALKANKHDIRGFEFSVVSGETVTAFTVRLNMAKVQEFLAYGFELKKGLEEDNLLSSRSKWVCNYCDWNSVCDRKL